MTPESLAARIRAERRRRGWTLKQLADRAGIGKTAMFDLEHGNPGVRLNTLLAVLDQLDLELSLGGEPAPPPPPRTAPAAATDLPDHLL